MGPTASGKTALAEAIAERLDAWLVNADAFQVYRGMDIGTAKPVERSRYRLLDIKDPNERFSVGEWVERAIQVLNAAWTESRNVVTVGGSGLYVRALFEEYAMMGPPPTEGLREALAARLESEGLEALREELRCMDQASWERTDLNNPQRVLRALERVQLGECASPIKTPPFKRRKFALNADPGALAARIEVRTRQMVEEGWLTEVNELLAKGYSVDDPGFRAHGYRAMASVVVGELPLAEAIARTTVEVRQYAKRQRTWLRKEPVLEWLPGCMIDESIEAILKSLANA
jgi:tRNA dimethylallyltransferase